MVLIRPSLKIIGTMNEKRKGNKSVELYNMKKFQIPKVETANLSHSLASTNDEATEITSGDENRQRNILVLDY